MRKNMLTPYQDQEMHPFDIFIFLEFQKQLGRYISALRTLAMERSRLLELLITGYPAAWGHKDQIERSHREQDTATENCITKENSHEKFSETHT